MSAVNYNARFAYFYAVWIALTLLTILAAGMGMHPSAPKWVTPAALIVWIAFVVPLVPIAIVQQSRTSLGARGMVIAGWLAMMLVGALAVSATGLIGRVREGNLTPGGLVQFLVAGGLAGIAVLIGLLLYSAAGRRFAARFIPINPQSFTDATALATAVPSLAFCLIPLCVMGQPKLNGSADLDSMTINALLAGQGVWSVFLTVFAAGFPLVRGWLATMRRLGVTRFSPGGFVVAILTALALVPTMPFLHSAIQQLWQKMGWPTTSEESLKDLFDSLLTPAGAIVIGLTAGISEELFFRGLLQPKLGLILSNALFAGVHAFQYAWDGLLVVFLIGLVCGYVRKRYNTVASMITHGLYDATLILATIGLGH